MMSDDVVSVNFWQEVKLGAEESRALRTQVQLAEAAQKQARGMEMDYEEVIHLLEAEIAELKTQRVEQPVPTNKVTNRQTKLTLFRLRFLSRLNPSVNNETTGRTGGLTYEGCTKVLLNPSCSDRIMRRSSDVVVTSQWATLP